MRKPWAVLTLISMLFAVPIARADDHLVTRGAVNQRLADAATDRARNLASVEGVLASPRASKAAAIAGVDLHRVRTSLPRLSDADLRDLSQRAAALKSDPAAGHYDEAEDALVLVIVIAAAALVLIAVANHY
jgi:pyruvate/2-oxoglutarate dehydrogenase complex dihydrolipoamide acyltransferase (E2) component